MSNILLSKNADKILCILYKEYLSNIKNGISKSEALNFNTEDIDNIFKNQDIHFELSELKNKSLIEIWITGDILLNSEAIIYMENRFKSNITEVVDFISNFIP